MTKRFSGQAELALGAYRTEVRLGYLSGERRKPQPVVFELKIRFRQAPRACRTDRLQDTVCYGKICERISQICAKRPYKLIEHLGAQVYEAVERMLPKGAALTLKLIKENPPVPGLTGGASFTLGPLGLGE